MGWLLGTMIAGYAMFLPVTLTIRIHHHGQLQTRLTLHFLCLHKTWSFDGLAGAAAPLRRNPDGRMRSAWRQAHGTRRFLRRHSEFSRLDVLVLLRTGDAARTALYTGVLRSVVTLFPRRNRRICIQPDFFRPRSTLQARCIIRWKLGTLILTAMMLLAETLLQRHMTESEAT